MSYIAPNSTVEFFGDLGLSDNYENSLYFDSVGEKDSYFGGISKIATSTAMSYNRSTRGSFRVELPMSTLINSSYIRFKNTSFENKWFYAFVKNVEMVNNVTTQVFFELDYLMTWMGGFGLGMCYIERQHTTTDAIGDNIVEESIDTGELVYDSNTSFQVISPIVEGVGVQSYDICIVSAVKEKEDSTQESPKFEEAEGGTYGYIYSGLETKYFNAGNRDIANEYLRRVLKANKIDSIVSIRMTPLAFRNELNESPNVINKTAPMITAGESLNGYNNIRNNKLYTYPYCFLQVSDGEGKAVDLRYEFFNTGVCGFAFFGITGAVCEVSCVPTAYKGVARNTEYQITIDNFPECAFNYSSYEAWLAQHKNESFYMSGVGALGTTETLFGGAVKSAISGITGGSTSAIRKSASTSENAGASMSAGATAQAITTGVNVLSELYSGFRQVSEDLAVNRDRMSKSPQIAGNTTTNVLYTFGLKDFWYARRCVTKEYARIIDNYFTMYGYAVKKVAVPNMNARPNFTYVKTIGCVVHGALPSEHASNIERIFDNGIRFWKNHSSIGNYNLNNSPN